MPTFPLYISTHPALKKSLYEKIKIPIPPINTDVSRHCYYIVTSETRNKKDVFAVFDAIAILFYALLLKIPLYLSILLFILIGKKILP